jgi:DNA repair exonuclease SbcCD nuclease subunit
MRFRFLHAADLHLDTPFSGLGQTSPEVAERLRDASLDAFDALVELAIARDVAFLLLAGDIYDGAERGVRAQLRFRRGLERLSQRGIPTLVVHGNHDPLDGWSAVRSWPERVHVFGPELESKEVHRDGRRIATVHGLSYPQREVPENLALRFAGRGSAGTGGGLRIGLLHGTVGAQSEHAAYAPCTLEDLRAAGMHYWALGHIHRQQVVSERDPWVVYPGNLQGRSPKPSERGAKGAVLVEADETGILGVEFVALDRARFLELRIDIGEIDDLPALHAALDAAANEAAAANAGRGLLLRATLTGRGALHADLRRPETLPELRRQLRDDAAAREPFVWWDGVEDETLALLDLDAIRARGDFAAEVLARADALRHDAERQAAFMAAAMRPLHARRWASEVELPTEQELLDAGAALALELLEAEGE